MEIVLTPAVACHVFWQPCNRISMHSFKQVDSNKLKVKFTFLYMNVCFCCVLSDFRLDKRYLQNKNI